MTSFKEFLLREKEEKTNTEETSKKHNNSDIFNAISCINDFFKEKAVPIGNNYKRIIKVISDINGDEILTIKELHNAYNNKNYKDLFEYNIDDVVFALCCMYYKKYLFTNKGEINQQPVYTALRYFASKDNGVLMNSIFDNTEKDAKGDFKPYNNKSKPRLTGNWRKVFFDGINSLKSLKFEENVYKYVVLDGSIDIDRLYDIADPERFKKIESKLSSGEFDPPEEENKENKENKENAEDTTERFNSGYYGFEKIKNVTNQEELETELENIRSQFNKRMDKLLGELSEKGKSSKEYKDYKKLNDVWEEAIKQANLTNRTLSEGFFDKINLKSGAGDREIRRDSNNQIKSGAEERAEDIRKEFDNDADKIFEKYKSKLEKAVSKFNDRKNLNAFNKGKIESEVRKLFFKLEKELWNILTKVNKTARGNFMTRALDAYEKYNNTKDQLELDDKNEEIESDGLAKEWKKLFEKNEELKKLISNILAKTDTPAQAIEQLKVNKQKLISFGADDELIEKSKAAVLRKLRKFLNVKAKKEDNEIDETKVKKYFSSGYKSDIEELTKLSILNIVDPNNSKGTKDYNTFIEFLKSSSPKDTGFPTGTSGKIWSTIPCKNSSKIYDTTNMAGIYGYLTFADLKRASNVPDFTKEDFTQIILIAKERSNDIANYKNALANIQQIIIKAGIKTRSVVTEEDNEIDSFINANAADISEIDFSKYQFNGTGVEDIALRQCTKFTNVFEKGTKIFMLNKQKSDEYKKLLSKQQNYINNTNSTNNISNVNNANNTNNTSNTNNGIQSCVSTGSCGGSDGITTSGDVGHVYGDGYDVRNTRTKDEINAMKKRLGNSITITYMPNSKTKIVKRIMN